MRPDVSVVIPTFHRPELLARCLLALAEQTLAPDRFEIIVADDGPDEATERLVKAFTAARPHAVQYVTVPASQGPAGARNAGWQRARAPIVAFTDDDTVPSPDWLREGLAAFAPDVVAAWGQIEVPLGDDPTDYEIDAAGLEIAEFATANVFCRLSILRQVGGFDERFTAAWREDSDLYFGILDLVDRPGDRRRVVKAPRALVRHPVRPAAWGVSIKQQKKAQYNALLYKKHPRLYRARIQRLPPWRYYAIVLLMASAVLGFFVGSRWLVAASFVGWLALTAWFCRERLSRTSRDPDHVAEMLVTSIAIPPLSVYWRLRGAIRYRVFFL